MYLLSFGEITVVPHKKFHDLNINKSYLLHFFLELQGISTEDLDTQFYFMP